MLDEDDDFDYEHSEPLLEIQKTWSYVTPIKEILTAVESSLAYVVSLPGGNVD